MMRNRLPTLMLFVAISVSLNACSDDKQAEVQKRYQALMQSDVQLQNANSSMPINLIEQQYEKQEDGSTTALEKLSIQPAFLAKPFPFYLTTDISFPDEAHLLGRSISYLQVKDEDLQPAFTQKDLDTIHSALNHIVFENDFLKNNQLIRRMEIKPFDYKSQVEAFRYSGLEASVQMAQENLDIFPFDTKGKFCSGDLFLKLPGIETTFYPFTGTFSSSMDGTLEAISSPIKAKANFKRKLPLTLEIQGLKFTGKYVAYDKTIHNFLGNYGLSTNEINFDDGKSHPPIVLKKLSISQGYEKDKDNLYSRTVTLGVAPETDFIKLIYATNDDSMKINQAHLSVSINHFSGELPKIIKEYLKQYYQDTQTEKAENLLMTTLKTHPPELNIQFSATTQQGDITLNLKSHLSDLSNADAFDVAKLGAKIFNFSIFNLVAYGPRIFNLSASMERLERNASVSGNLVLPKAFTRIPFAIPIFNKINVEHFKEDDNNYTAAFSIENGKLFVNGDEIL